MSLFKRGEVWWCDLAVPGRGRTRISAGTGDRKAAQEFHDLMKAKLYREAKLGERPQRTWSDACVRWLRETQDKKDHSGDCEKIAFFNQYLSGKLLTDITSDLLSEIVEAHKGHVAGPTRNRYYALARAIMRRAALKWKWIEPGEIPYVNMHKESDGRERYLEPEEFRRLLMELPAHWRAVAGLAVATGLRMSNVIGLKWADVNFERRSIIIRGREMKNGKDLAVPLNDLALAVLDRQRGKHLESVFVNENGKSVGKLRGSVWKNALKRAGIEEGFRFHDFRHTWASWLIQNGAPEHFAQALGGWKTAAMVKRYATLQVQHLASTAGLIDRVFPAELMLTVA